MSMIEYILILYLVNPSWEILLENATCNDANTEYHYSNDNCNLDICIWNEGKKKSTTIIFMKCKEEKLICKAYENGIDRDCSLYEKEIRF